MDATVGPMRPLTSRGQIVGARWRTCHRSRRSLAYVRDGRLAVAHGSAPSGVVLMSGIK